MAGTKTAGKCPQCGRDATANHDEALELLAAAARTGDIRAVVAYERATWRDGRDSGAAAKKDKGKVSRAQNILDELQEESEDDALDD